MDFLQLFVLHENVDLSAELIMLRGHCKEFRFKLTIQNVSPSLE